MSKEEKSEIATAVAVAMQMLADVMKATMQPLLERLERLEAGRASNLTPDQQFHKTLETIRGSTDDVETIGLVEVVEGCKSDLGAPDADGTMRGATFDAEIHYTPVMNGGKLVAKTSKCRVVQLLRYRWPDGFDKHVSQGGLVPDGLEIKSDANARSGYDQWLWETFLQADTRRFVGKALPAHVRHAPLASTGT
jgi:hypothetical protein